MQPTELFRKKIALLLDFDGTLADLAEDPMQVEVDPALAGTLEKIVQDKKIPVAIVTGRQIDVLDGFLKLPNLPVSGNHGTEIRMPDSGVVTRHVPPIPALLWRSIQGICKSFGGVLEDKIETAVIHIKNESAFFLARDDLAALLSRDFKDYAMWPVGLSLEIHNRACNKMTGIREILAHDVFKKHKPIYIGDDVGTYPGIETLREDKVTLLSVGSGEECVFKSTQQVRDFLARFAEHS